MLDSPIAKLAITGAVLYAAWRWGNQEMKIAALGAAGYIALQQIPVVRDGAAVKLVA